MTQGPPCPNCGNPLRWFPEIHQWGCDREQIMFPAQPVDPMFRPAPRRAIWPWVALAAVVLAFGGVAAWVFLGRSSKGGGGGGGSSDGRDDLVRETFSSLAAGDHGGLVSRSGLGIVMHHVQCANGEMPDVSKDLSDFSEQIDRAIGRAKGATFEIESIDEPEAAKTTPQGGEVAKGCKLDLEMVTHQLAVKVKITRDGRTSDGTAKLTLVELKGKWHTMSPPLFVGGCDAAVARIAVVGGRDAKDPELATKLQPALIAQCETAAWAPGVVDCLTKALGLPDVAACTKQLTADQQTKLRGAIAPVLTASTPAAAALRDIAPSAAGTPATPATPTTPATPAAVTQGKPAPGPIADFWTRTRSDGTVLVTSPLAEAVFPHAPKFEVVKSPKKRGDGTTMESFQVTDQAGESMFQLELFANGHGLTDADITKSIDALHGILAKVGTVTESKRDDHGQTVYAFAATDRTGATIRSEMRIDRAHGYSMGVSAVTTAATTALGDAFLASAHMRTPADPVADQTTLEGVRLRKAGKKFVAHDKTDSFTIEIPSAATVERKFAPETFHVTATIKVKQKKGELRVLVQEVAPWDGLDFGPTGLVEGTAILEKALKSEYGMDVASTTTTLAGQPATRFDSKKGAARKFRAYSVWNRFQHRTYQVLCMDVGPACDATAQSLHFADPTPVE